MNSPLHKLFLIATIHIHLDLPLFLLPPWYTSMIISFLLISAHMSPHYTCPNHLYWFSPILSWTNFQLKKKIKVLLQETVVNSPKISPFRLCFVIMFKNMNSCQHIPSKNHSWNSDSANGIILCHQLFLSTPII